MADAVARAHNRAEALRILGAPSSGSSYYSALDRFIARTNTSTAHFRKYGSTREPYKNSWTRRFTAEELTEAVKSSVSVREAIKKLGLIGEGGNYRSFWKYVKELDLSTAHFTGKRSNKGKRIKVRLRPLEEILRENSPYKSHALKLRLWEEGLKPKYCELCGWAEVSVDGRLPLELDHTNGDHTDNRIENLRILCPNCHSLQPTHRGRNVARCRVFRRQ